MFQVRNIGASGSYRSTCVVVHEADSVDLLISTPQESALRQLEPRQVTARCLKSMCMLQRTRVVKCRLHLVSKHGHGGPRRLRDSQDLLYLGLETITGYPERRTIMKLLVNAMYMA